MNFFNEFKEVHKTKNNFPHWQQENATYFLTYRLADSLPSELLGKLRSEKEAWKESNPTPWSNDQEMEYHRLFSAEIDRMLDKGHGICVLRETENSKIVSDVFKHFDGERYLIHSFVIMPNHVHILVSLETGTALEKLVASWKRYSANDINKRNAAIGTVWQRDYFDRIIRDWDHFANVARYIRRNPSKAKLRNDEFELFEAEWIKRMLG